MTQVPAGWYADPTAPQHDGHGRLRYWDGADWTDQVHMPAPAYPQGPAYPPQAYYGPQVPSTPDGVPLAGWWSRVLAQIVDGFVLTPFLLLAMAPVVASQWDAISSWFDDSMTAAENGTAAPGTPALFDPTTAAGLTLLVVPPLVALVYSVVFLRWKQATLGQQALGLRVRMRENPALPWSAILPRVGFVTGLSLLAAIPYVGALFSIASLVNYLWPLWDSKKQALHDKVAGTNVVKVR